MGKCVSSLEIAAVMLIRAVSMNQNSEAVGHNRNKNSLA